MERIVVANLFRLGKDGDKFSKDFKKIVRSRAKVTESYVKGINANWKMGGMIYEIDEKATKERDEKLLNLTVQFDSKTVTRDELKDKADKMELTYAKNIKTDKLFELIKANK